MDGLYFSVVDAIRTFDYNSPAVFWFAAALVSLLLKRINILLTIIVIMFVGAHIEQYIAFAVTFNNYTLTAPFVVYVAGGVWVSVMTFNALFGR